MQQNSRQISRPLTTTSAPSENSGIDCRRSARGCLRSARNQKARTVKVARIATKDGRAKLVSHSTIPGGRPSYKTGLAGLEIGRIKLAAFAIKAQANK